MERARKNAFVFGAVVLFFASVLATQAKVIASNVSCTGMRSVGLLTGLHGEADLAAEVAGETLSSCDENGCGRSNCGCRRFLTDRRDLLDNRIYADVFGRYLRCPPTTSGVGAG